MTYLLDTNAVIALLNDANSPTSQRARQFQPADMAVSSVVMHELYFGAFKSRRREHNVALLEALQFEVLPFDKEDAREAGEIRASLSAQGTPIGPFDILIAGQARSRNLILVTHNTREFSRIPGLQVQDWEIPNNG